MHNSTSSEPHQPKQFFVFGAGKNNYNQLGLFQDGCSLKSQHSLRYIPSISSFQQTVKQIQSGYQHSTILTYGGEVLTCGNNPQGGLGLIHRRAVLGRWEPLHLFKEFGIPISQIALGGSHTLALSREGKVYSFGSNECGQLGLNHTSNRSAPEEIRQLSRAVMIRAGSDHSMVLTEKGRLFVFGSNNYGQLGLGDAENRSTPTKLSMPLVQEGDDSQEETVVDIACENAAEHCLILCESGAIMSFGYGAYGQLGHGDNRTRRKPEPIAFFQRLQQDYKLLESSDQHHHDESSQPSELAQETTELLVHGSSGYFAMMPQQQEKKQKQKQQQSSWIQSIRVGMYSSFVLLVDGSLYCFGKNEYGEMAQDTALVKYLNVPTTIDFFSGARVTQVHCGLYHALAVVDDAKVFTWGNSEHGQCALESTSEHNDTPSQIPIMDIADKMVMAAAAADNNNSNGTLSSLFCPGNPFKIQQIWLTSDETFIMLFKYKGWPLSLLQKLDSYSDVRIRFSK